MQEELSRARVKNIPKTSRDCLFFLCTGPRSSWLDKGAAAVESGRGIRYGVWGMGHGAWGMVRHLLHNSIEWQTGHLHMNTKCPLPL